MACGVFTGPCDPRQDVSSSLGAAQLPHPTRQPPRVPGLPGLLVADVPWTCGPAARAFVPASPARQVFKARLSCGPRPPPLLLRLASTPPCGRSPGNFSRT